MESSMQIKMSFQPEAQRLQMEFKGSGSFTFTDLDLIQMAKTYITGLNTLIELQLFRLANPDEHHEKPGEIRN